MPPSGAGGAITIELTLTPFLASVQVGLVAIQFLRCFLCFQLHCPTKSAFEIFQALAKFSPPPPPAETKKQKKKAPLPGLNGSGYRCYEARCFSGAGVSYFTMRPAGLLRLEAAAVLGVKGILGIRPEVIAGLLAGLCQPVVSAVRSVRIIILNRGVF